MLEASRHLCVRNPFNPVCHVLNVCMFARRQLTFTKNRILDHHARVVTCWSANYSEVHDCGKDEFRLTEIRASQSDRMAY
jgi:hypothetical protein